jgi:hypothetical protein
MHSLSTMLRRLCGNLSYPVVALFLDERAFNTAVVSHSDSQVTLYVCTGATGINTAEIT